MVATLFQDIHSLGKEFNQELDTQGGKLETIANNLESVNENANKGAQ